MRPICTYTGAGSGARATVSRAPTAAGRVAIAGTGCCGNRRGERSSWASRRASFRSDSSVGSRAFGSPVLRLRTVGASLKMTGASTRFVTSVLRLRAVGASLRMTAGAASASARPLARRASTAYAVALPAESVRVARGSARAAGSPMDEISSGRSAAREIDQRFVTGRNCGPLPSVRSTTRPRKPLTTHPRDSAAGERRAKPRSHARSNRTLWPAHRRRRANGERTR
jgi:hypothetical protein